MTARDIFYTPAGTLRAPWRLLLFALALVASTVVASEIVGPLLGGMFSVAGMGGQSIASLLEMITALIATWFCLRVVEKKEWSEVGLHTAAAQPRRIGIGLLLGSGAITLAIVLLIVVGWLDREAGNATSWGGPLLRMTMLLLPAAFAEELITRGYVLTLFKDAIGWRWAVVVTSVGFGLAHLQNPGANVQSLAFVALAGVFLAAVRIATDSLYAAWAAHFAWNWVMAALFHAPVSGFAFEYPSYRYVDAGPDWATGGHWGPESGIPSGIMLIIATAFILRRRLLPPQRSEPQR